VEAQLALVVGFLYGASIYLMLRRSLIKLIFGLALISHASNLLIFSMGRVTRGHPPLIAEGETVLMQPFADPLPQALILTAIVIAFGVQAFALILVRKAYRAVGTDDLDKMNTTDTLEE